MRWLNARIAMTMLLLAGALIAAGPQAHAQQTASVSVTVKNHRFQPAEVQAPANVPIDQSFIRDLPTKGDSVAIVRAVVGLSSSLGITTTAEGVETKEQLASLTAEGCNEFQGFLFSQPRPAAEIQRMLGELAPRAEAVA
jgi:hypothetical protein